MTTDAPAMTRSLLIVDDNESVRESLRFFLEIRGYGAAVAASGAEAIALASQQAFDGAIVDINMPCMNGVAVCRALRARAAETGQRLAVWMMTGAYTPEMAKASAEAGALGIFGKPFDFDEVFRQFDEQWAVRPPAEPGLTA